MDGAPAGPGREPQPRPHGGRGVVVLRGRRAQGRAGQHPQQVRSVRPPLLFIRRTVFACVFSWESHRFRCFSKG